VLKQAGRELDGWTLNVSRGGVRLILEETVQVGDEFEVLVGGAEQGTRPGRVVWIKEMSDGQIVGMQFLDSSEPPPARSDPPADGQ
jgi:hypothetical protein